MSYSCPLNFVQVDSNASRISSLIVATLVFAYLFTSLTFILYFLVFDFSLKLFLNKKYSLISILALYLRKLFTMKEKLTDGGAKRLAGIFGLIFVLLLLITDLLALKALSFLVAGIFLLCSLLDLIFNYCLGCKIYYIIKKIYPNFMS